MLKESKTITQSILHTPNPVPQSRPGHSPTPATPVRPALISGQRKQPAHSPNHPITNPGALHGPYLIVLDPFLSIQIV